MTEPVLRKGSAIAVSPVLLVNRYTAHKRSRICLCLALPGYGMAGECRACSSVQSARRSYLFASRSKASSTRMDCSA